MKKFRLGALVLATVMFLGMFTGCNEKRETLVTIDGQNIPRYMFEFFAYNISNNYASSGMDLASVLDQDAGDGVTVDELLKSQILDTLKAYVAIEKLAKENGLELTKDDLKTIEENKAQQIEQAGGRKKFAEQLEKENTVEEAFDKINYYGAVYSKAFQGLYREGGKFAPTTEDVVENTLHNVRVKHVLIQATKEDEDYQSKKDLAYDIQKRATAGEDFDKLISEYGEDPGMESLPEGYVFDQTGMLYDGSSGLDAQFTAASVALAVNGVSPVVETDFGFHIIKRYPFDEAYINQNIDTYAYPIANQLFQVKINEVSQELTVVETEAYKNFTLKELLGTVSAETPDMGATGELVPEAE